MEKLTNKIPVLDKGHVAVISTSMSCADLLDVQRNYFSGYLDESLLSLPKVHIAIKCPLFVQLNLSKFGFTILVNRYAKLESYIPQVDEIGAKDLATSQEIQQSIEETSEALLINPKAYKHEGCDTFISQILCPISMYNTLIVSGNLDHWMKFTRQKHLPKSIEAYRSAVEEVLLAEWNYLDKYIKPGE